MNKRLKKIIPAILIILIAVQGHSLSYRKYERIHRKAVNTYRKLYKSKIKWRTAGRSARNRRIYYRSFGEGENTILVLGGIHGDEPASAISVVKLAHLISKNRKLIKNRVILVPYLNPDGIIRGTRVNAGKVDLNRNYPAENWTGVYEKKYNYPGRKPGSEPETKLAIKLIKKYKPVLIIQMHQPFNTIYYDANVPEKLSKKMSEISGLPLADDVDYRTPGSLGSYAEMEKIKIPVITYEMGRIDKEPDYKSVNMSIIEAVNFFKNEN